MLNLLVHILIYSQIAVSGVA